jgi:DNA-binding MarR family transcriptional regulator
MGRSETSTARQDSIDRFLEQALELYPTLDREVEGAVERLWRIVKYLMRTTERTVGEFDLNSGEFHLLLKLRQAPTQRLAAGELSERLSLSSGAMTNRLDGLEEAGLITRERDTSDRRSVIVGLTDAGVEVVGRAVGAQAEVESSFLGVLTAVEQRRLNGLLRKLVLELEDRKEKW